MQRAIQSVLAAAILFGTVATTRAESVMKQCGVQWQAAKSAGTTIGATWPPSLAQCRAQLSSGAATVAPTPTPAQPQTGSLFPWQQPASSAPAPVAPTATGNQSVMKQCGAQWQGAAKAAGTTSETQLGHSLTEGLPDAARLDDERAAAGRLCPGRLHQRRLPSSADAIGFTFLPVAAAEHLLPLRRCECRPRGGSVSPQQAQYRCPTDQLFLSFGCQ